MNSNPVDYFHSLSHTNKEKIGQEYLKWTPNTDFFTLLNDTKKEKLGQEYLKWTKSNVLLSAMLQNHTVKKFFALPSYWSKKEPAPQNQTGWEYFRKHFPKVILIMILVHVAQSQARGVYMFSRFLHNINTGAFEEACKDLKYNFTPSLTPSQTVAFQIYTGITDYQRMKINRFLRLYTDGKSMMATNQQCLNYKRSTSLEPISMEIDEIVEDTEDPNYKKVSYKPFFRKSLKTIILDHLNLLCDAYASTSLGRYLKKFGKCVPITISGDYGDEDMKIVAAISATKQSGQKHVYSISSYHDKESYNYMSRLIFPPINEDINYLKTRCIITIQTHQQYAYAIVPNIWKDHIENIEFVKDTANPTSVVGVQLSDDICLFERHRSLLESEILKEKIQCLPFAFFACGDLSYLFLIQGRKTYCSANCFCCKSKARDWKQRNISYSTRSLTHSEMSRLGALNKPEENYGFNTLKCLLPSIEMENWIIPILHIELGLVSLLVREIFEFCYSNIEAAPPSILLIREQLLASQAEVKRLQEALADMKKERFQEVSSSTQPFKRQKTIDGAVSSSNGSASIVTLQSIETLIREENKRITSLKHQEDSIWKRSNLPIKDQISDILAKNGIVQQQYFGGHTLIGQHCQNFLYNHESILCDIHKVFWNAIGNRSELQSKIATFIVTLAELCELLQSIFYFLFRCDTIATNEECDDLELLCSIFSERWRLFFNEEHTTPKFHLLEAHAVSQLRLFGCLGEFTEEPIEKHHHHYKRLNQLYKACKDVGQRYKMIEDRLNLCHMVSNKAIINQVITFTKRPKSLNRSTSSQEKRAESVKKIIENFKNNKQNNVASIISNFIRLDIE